MSGLSLFIEALLESVSTERVWLVEFNLQEFLKAVEMCFN